MKYLTLSLLCCLNAAAAGSCPTSVFIQGNNLAAITLRKLIETDNRAYLQAVPNKGKAEAVIEVSSEPRDQGVGVAATLTTSAGDLVWSSTAWRPPEMSAVEIGVRLIWRNLREEMCAAEERNWKEEQKAAKRRKPAAR